MAHDDHKQSRPVRQFKDTTVFDWDAEPADERPSEFVSTSYSVLSGFSTLSGYSTLDAHRARKSERQGSLGTLLVALLVFFAIGVGGLFGLMRLLHA